MARRDRTFTHADLFRFYCNNLSKEEQLLVIREFNYGNPCTEGPSWFEALGCENMGNVLFFIDGVCSVAEMILPWLRWGPLRRIQAPLMQMCGYVEYLNYLYETICGGADRLSLPGPGRDKGQRQIDRPEPPQIAAPGV